MEVVITDLSSKQGKQNEKVRVFLNRLCEKVSHLFDMQLPTMTARYKLFSNADAAAAILPYK